MFYSRFSNCAVILFFMFEKSKMKSEEDSSPVPGSVCKKRKRQSFGEDKNTKVQHCSRLVGNGNGLEIGALEADMRNGGKQHKKKKHAMRDNSSCTENVDAIMPCKEIKQEIAFPKAHEKARKKKKKKKEKHFRRGDDAMLRPNTAGSDITEPSEVVGEIPIVKRKKKRKKRMDGAATPQAKVDSSEMQQTSPKKHRKPRKLELKTTMEGNWQDKSAETPRNSSKKHLKKHKDAKAENKIEGNLQLSSAVCKETLGSPAKKHKKKSKALKLLQESGEVKGSKETDAVQRSPFKRKSVTAPEDSIHTEKDLPASNGHRRKKKHKKSVKKKSTTCQQSLAESAPDLTDLKLEQSTDEMVEQLNKFIPNVRMMANSTIYSMFKYDLPRFKMLKEEGIPIRQGRYTKQENKQIRKNLKELMLLTGIEDEWDFFQAPESSEELLRIKRLKIKHLFCIKLAEGIARPWKSVYQRARKIYDPHRCKGRYTEEELKKIKRLMTMHGNHWRKIADGLERSDLSVMCRARIMKDSLKSGPWSKEEERKLMKIMKEVINKRAKKDNSLAITAPTKSKLVSILREKLYKGLPWLEISNQMEERHWIQCRKKWMKILTNKMSQGSVSGRREKNYRCKINLIKRLYLLNVDEDSKVDWEALCDAVGNVPPQFVQTMFYKLKARNVPCWQRKTFGEIVDFLHEKICPKYEASLRKSTKHSSDCSTEAIPKPLKREFQLSDIFNSDDDDEDDDNYIFDDKDEDTAHPTASDAEYEESSQSPAAGE